MMAAKIPCFKFPPIRSVAMPTTLGPLPQPRSPARAKKANMAVPPRRMDLAPMEKQPGHMIPTERPHRAQPARLKTVPVKKMLKDS